MNKWMLGFAALLLAAATSARAGAPELKTDDQKTLYALGLAMSQSLSSFNLTDAELDLVKAGLTDGAFTEVEGARLTEGLPVVVGEGAREAVAPSTAERNPFAPQMPFRGNRQAQGQTEGSQAPGQENQGQQAPTSRPGQ